MACGKPIVGPSGSSYQEVVEESSAGAVWDSDNLEDLPETMVGTAAEAERYKEKARAYALTHNWSNITDAVERVYERISER